jgi:two-component system alkaline phosphatase synthesis response regulator PhoP
MDKKNHLDHPHKILIVDDDEGILEAISVMLQMEGYEVFTSSQNGKYLFGLISKNNPDLILLDVLLSGVDGRDVCKQLKNNPVSKHTPVIMISAHLSARKNFYEYGAQAFLAKPFNIDELLETITKFTNK